MLTLPVCQAQAAMTAGQIMGIDFGPTLPTNNFNPTPPIGGPSSPGSPPVGTALPAGSVIDTVGATIPDVSVSFSGFSSQSDTSIALNGSEPAIFNDSNIADVARSQGPTLVTISGLDPLLRYDVTFLCALTSWPGDVDYYVNSNFVGSISPLSAVRHLDVAGLQTTPTGDLIILSDTAVVSTGGAFSAITITAVTSVPEPTVGIYAGLAALLLMGRRR